MTIPKVVQNIQDGGLGAVAQSSDDVCAVIGCCSGGAPNVPTRYAAGQTKRLIADYGHGPAVELGALKLAAGQPIVFCKTASAVVGDEGSQGTDNKVTFTGTGTSVITLQGNALDTFEGVFEVVTGGTIGTAGITFRYSLDHGRTYSPPTTLGTASTLAIPNSGITLSFAAGTLVAGDKAAFSSVEPKWDTAGLIAAFAALFASPITWGYAHVVGPMSATEAGTVELQMEAADNAFRYVSALCEARGRTPGESEAQWMTAISTDYASFSSTRVVVGAGQCKIVSPISGRAYMRPMAWAASVRASAVDIHVDLARVKDGPLDASIVDDDGNLVAHDERVAPGLDAARFMSLTTIIGKVGVYVTNPNVMAPSGSDFTLWQYRRVMDRACAITYHVLVDELSDSVRLDRETGYILEQDARSIESKGNSALRDQLEAKGSVSPGGAKIILSRTDNISSTKTINATTRLLPLGYLKEIINDIGYTNPALKVA